MKAVSQFALGLAIGWAPVSGLALDLELPATAQLTAERVTELGSFDVPVAAFGSSGLPVETLEGRIDRKAWRIAAQSMTPLQVLAPLRDQLEQLGYRVEFECDSVACGGFDFRFATEVLPGPNMYVNLSQYRYLTAFAGPSDDPEEAVGILVSVADTSAYLQVIHADTSAMPARETKPVVTRDVSNTEPLGEVPLTLRDSLTHDGRVVLRDLEFETGTSELGQGPYPSLTELADLLVSDTTLRLALVGHTDATGGLETNVALSRARASSVRQRLIDTYGVAAGQLDAEGMGYLSPVATNLTPEGREQNRRVEAVLLNVE